MTALKNFLISKGAKTFYWQLGNFAVLGSIAFLQGSPDLLINYWWLGFVLSGLNNLTKWINKNYL